MHPILLEGLARSQTAEMRAGAGRRRAASRCRPKVSMRQQVGWALMQLGLRLAVGQG